MGINDICERYGIESHSLEEIRTELKRMLKDNHLHFYNEISFSSMNAPILDWETSTKM